MGEKDGTLLNDRQEFILFGIGIPFAVPLPSRGFSVILRKAVELFKHILIVLERLRFIGRAEACGESSLVYVLVPCFPSASWLTFLPHEYE